MGSRCVLLRGWLLRVLGADEDLALPRDPRRGARSAVDACYLPSPAAPCRALRWWTISINGRFGWHARLAMMPLKDVW